MRSYSLSFLLFAFLLLIQDAQEKNPGKLRHILQRARTVAPAHDITDRFYDLIHRMLGGKVFIVVFSFPRTLILFLCLFDKIPLVVQFSEL